MVQNSNGVKFVTWKQLTISGILFIAVYSVFQFTTISAAREMIGVHSKTIHENAVSFREHEKSEKIIMDRIDKMENAIVKNIDEIRKDIKEVKDRQK